MTAEKATEGTTQQTTQHANCSSEIFVGITGETTSNTLQFFNLGGPKYDNFKLIQKIELLQEASTYMSAFATGNHFSIVMVSGGGSLFVWSPRPAKIIQPLAPNFTEVEENVLYIEREDEFDEEEDSADETPQDQIDDGGLGNSLIAPLTQKQRKLAKTKVDINSVEPLHMARKIQGIAYNNQDDPD